VTVLLWHYSLCTDRMLSQPDSSCLIEGREADLTVYGIRM
jgi:hypothetical protein